MPRMIDHLENPESLPEGLLKFLRCAPSPKSAVHLEGMLRRISAAHMANDTKQLRYLIQEYLSSLDAKLTATRQAARKMDGKYRPKELETIALNLNAYEGTQEEAKLFLKRKSRNTFRPTLDFGIENRALQYLVASVLYAIADVHPHQFLIHGGTPAAIAHVVTAMKTGNLWARETDISDCYPSFDADRLADLIPLPKRVIERVLISQHLNIVLGNLPRSLRDDSVPTPDEALTPTTGH